jgi:hypothetical protein
VKNLSLAMLVFAAATLSFAQTSTSVVSANAVPPAAATTVSRTTKAVHYRLQGGTTKVDFRGTDLPAQDRYGAEQVSGSPSGSLPVCARDPSLRLENGSAQDDSSRESAVTRTPCHARSLILDLYLPAAALH